MTTFRTIQMDEVSQVLELIRARMAWMDWEGIHHWNDFAYDELYPLSYYEERCRNGELFVLVDDAPRILASAVVLSHDARWPDDPPAIYVHALVSRIGVAGAGSQFLECVEEYAAGLGRQYCRLDVQVGSDVLAQYYDARGYVSVGECTEGEYHGILRQKELQTNEARRGTGMNAIFHRVSIRKYEDRPVEADKVEMMLRAAMAAP